MRGISLNRLIQNLRKKKCTSNNCLSNKKIEADISSNNDTTAVYSNRVCVTFKREGGAS